MKAFASGLLAVLTLSGPSLPAATRDEQLYRLARTDLPAFAREVSAGARSELGQAQAIVRWLAVNFEWKATDYEDRTVQQIVDRRGGNCNELAMVALAAMKSLDIRLRRVHEVNIHVPSDRRGDDARKLVHEKGPSYSVFGRHHNDHVWLELWDSSAHDWLPADPSSGLVGLDDWMQGRVGFGSRKTLNPLTDDMVVPFAVFAADADGRFTINRTQHYLVDSFDALTHGRLRGLPAWAEWTAALGVLDDHVADAFAGKHDLHTDAATIDVAAAAYEKLRAAANRGATPR